MDIPLYKFYLFFRRILIFMKYLPVCLFSLTFDIWKILLVGCIESICFEVPGKKKKNLSSIESALNLDPWSSIFLML